MTRQEIVFSVGFFLYSVLCRVPVVAGEEILPEDPHVISTFASPVDGSLMLRWISAEYAEDNLHLFSEYDLEILSLIMDKPENPETGCIDPGLWYDTYGFFEGPRTAELILKLRITRSTTGFSGSIPGTLYRGDVVQIARQSALIDEYTSFDFFIPRGEVPWKGKKICPADPDFVEIQVGDEVIVLSPSTRLQSGGLLQTGEGGVIVLRDGEIVPHGKAYQVLRPESASDFWELLLQVPFEPRDPREKMP